MSRCGDSILNRKHDAREILQHGVDKSVNVETFIGVCMYVWSSHIIAEYVSTG